MSYFQCKLCNILVPSKFSIWSHLRLKHGVQSSSDHEDKDWRVVPLLTGLKVMAIRLTEDDVFEATTHITLQDIQNMSPPRPPDPSSLTSTSTSLPPFRTATATITTSSGRMVKRKRFNEEVIEEDEETGVEEISTEKVLVGVEDTNSNNVWRYHCIPCKLKFRLLIYLRRHRWNVHGQKKPDFYCNTCDRSFKVKTLLEYHKLTHAPDWDILTLEEQKKRKWDSRMAVMESRKYKCPDCNKKFIYEANFRNHCRSHTNERGYKCLTCGAAYRQPYSLQVHLQENKCEKKILEELNRPFQCEVCKSCLKSEKGLYSHKLKQHGIRLPEKPNLHHCLFCEFVGATASELINHNRCHSGDRPFVCEACGMRFSAKHNMRSHVRLHCPTARAKGLDKIAEMEARRNQERIQSERKTKREKNLGRSICPECSQSFSTLTSMTTHRRRHGDKYKCDFCSAGYKNQRALFYHRTQAHNEQIGGHFCHICCKNMSSKNGLKRHYWTVHMIKSLPDLPASPNQTSFGNRKRNSSKSQPPSIASSTGVDMDPLACMGQNLLVEVSEEFSDTYEDHISLVMDDISESDENPEIRMKMPVKRSHTRQPAASSSSWIQFEDIQERDTQLVKMDLDGAHENGYSSSVDMKEFLSPETETATKTELLNIDIIDIEPESGNSIVYSYQIVSDDSETSL